MKIILLNLLMISSAFAYNHELCKKAWEPDNRSHTFPFNLLTWSTSVAPSSTVQYITSTGSCSALGLAKAKINFVAHNENQIKNDIAIGKGEFLQTYAYLTGCGLDKIYALKDSFLSQKKSLYDLECH